MKEIAFRPLRRLKSGKIAVASYMQWRKLMVADYRAFELAIRDEYRFMRPEEQVHNHKGQPLFFYTFDPALIPIFRWTPLMDMEQVRAIHGEEYAIQWGETGHAHYTRRGMDCDGVPTFTHFTAKNIVDFSFDHIDILEPLTVDRVLHWWGWLLYRMENVRFVNP